LKHFEESDFFPKHPPTLDDHHDVLSRHGRIMAAQVRNYLDLLTRIDRLEKNSPQLEISELEKRLTAKVTQLDTDVKIEVARIRTALIVAATLVGGGAGASKVVDALQPPQPINVQVVAPKVQP